MLPLSFLATFCAVAVASIVKEYVDIFHQRWENPQKVCAIRILINFSTFRCRYFRNYWSEIKVTWYNRKYVQWNVYMPNACCFQPIIQTSTVQGHPGSMFIVPVEKPFVVCYLTSFKSNIVSVTIFEIFALKIPDLNLGRFKVIQGQSLWCQSIAHGGFSIRLSLTQLLYLSPFFAIFNVQF